MNGNQADVHLVNKLISAAPDGSSVRIVAKPYGYDVTVFIQALGLRSSTIAVHRSPTSINDALRMALDAVAPCR